MIGLETLQLVTNSFLGRFVDFIYQYDGDGKLSMTTYILYSLFHLYLFTYIHHNSDVVCW